MQHRRASHRRCGGGVVDLVGTGQACDRQGLGRDAVTGAGMRAQAVVSRIAAGQAQATEVHTAGRGHIFAVEGGGGGAAQTDRVAAVGLAVAAVAGARIDESLQHRRAGHRRCDGAVIDLVGAGQACDRQGLGRDAVAGTGVGGERVVARVQPAQAQPVEGDGVGAGYVLAVEAGAGRTAQADGVNGVSLAIRAAATASADRRLQRRRAAHHRRAAAVIDLVGAGQAAHGQCFGTDAGCVRHRAQNVITQGGIGSRQRQARD